MLNSHPILLCCARCAVLQELAPDCHLVKLGTMGEYGE